VAEKTAKNFRGLLFLLHPVHTITCYNLQLTTADVLTSTACKSTFWKTLVSLNGFGGTAGGAGCGVGPWSWIGIGRNDAGGLMVIELV